MSIKKDTLPSDMQLQFSNADSVFLKGSKASTLTIEQNLCTSPIDSST